MAQQSSEEVCSITDVTDHQSNYDKIINNPIYEEMKLNKKLSEELKFSEALCNQLKNKYESLGKYCEDLRNNFSNINNILGEKQELKKKIGDSNDHDSKLIKLLVETLEEKNNIIQEKDKIIQVTDNSIREKDEKIQEKNKIILEKDNFIQQKDSFIELKDNFIQEQKKEIQNMQEKYNEIQKVVKKLKEQNKEIQKIQEKDKIIQEKENVIQEKDKKIQVTDNLIREKDREIQEKNKEIQEKNKIIQQKENIIKIKDELTQKQKKEIQNMQEKCNGIQEVVKKLKGQNKEIQKDNVIQEKENAIQEKDKEIQEKNKIIQEKDIIIHDLIQEKDNLIQQKNSFIELKDNTIQEQKKEIQDLKQYNAILKNEVANFRLSDDDKNHSAKLKEDIMNLRHSLENYITKCKGNVEINIPKVQELLKTYGSQTDITKDPKKPLIRVAIQRHIIEQILLYAKEYFGDKEQHIYGRGMESFMYRKAYELIKVAEVFAVKRDGIDETTEVFPIKLRQLIFATLGNRGFNNVINNNNQNFTHDFIRKYQSVLNKEIEKYRKLKDPEKKQEIEDMAGDIIRRVVTLFWFRLNVQEPIAEYFWFRYKEKINPSCMEGIWDDEDINNIVVDICHFPLIANKSTGQIYTPAKVFHIHKEEIKKNGII
jgi:uncharacterized protein (DUF3084 family)